MLANVKKDIPRYVDPESFVKLYNQHATVDCIYRAIEIAEEVRASRSNWGEDPQWDYMLLVGAVFEAGRMQGKREERLRHV